MYLEAYEGYPFYTIGQRRGLNLPMGKPVYVTHINPYTNTITIGEKEDLIETTLTAKELNFIKYDSVPNDEMEIIGAIRYNDDGAIGTLKQLGEDEIMAFFKPVEKQSPLVRLLYATKVRMWWQVVG